MGSILGVKVFPSFIMTAGIRVLIIFFLITFGIGLSSFYPSIPSEHKSFTYLLTEICDNGIDDDGDGLIDTDDPDCCDNFTDAGTIGHDHSVCGPTGYPSLIQSINLPTGGSGAINYMWLASTEGCPDNFNQAVPNSNSPTYQPEPITQTTWYRRCAWREGCPQFAVIESNCVKVEVINDPNATVNIISDFNGSPISCAQAADGVLALQVNSGSGPFTYEWNTGQTGTTISGLKVGIYIVTVTDTNGCTTFVKTTLDEPSPVTVYAQANNNSISCNGTADGSAVANAFGGTGNITFLWSNNQSGSIATNLSAGIYFVTATDTNGCSATDEVVLEEPDQVVITNIQSSGNYNGMDISCNGKSDGAATVNVSGGVLPYTYLWSNGQTTNVASNLSAGNYLVTVADANNCSTTSNITLTEPSLLTCISNITSFYLDGVNISTQGGSDGSISVNANGGTGDFTYLWNNGQTTAEATNLTAGTYTVEVKDANGCICNSTVTINDPAKLGDLIFEDLNGNGIQNIGEPGIPNVNITLTGNTANSAAITRSTITDQDGKYHFDGLPPGTYQITVPSPNGFLITAQNQGGVEKSDSDIDPDNGMSDAVTLGAGEFYPDLDAGFLLLTRVGNYAWKDCNKNGIQDGGEEGLGFVPVTLNGIDGLGNPVSKSASTDANGFYEFVNLKPGDYTITFDFPTTPIGLAYTSKDQGDDEVDSDVDANGTTASIHLKSGDNFQHIDAGFIDNMAPIIDPATNDLTVECDGNGNINQLNEWLSTNAGAQVSDNCTATSNIVWSNNFNGLNGDCGATGSVTVIFTASDECGNNSTSTATFTIEDYTLPKIHALASDLIVECDGNGNTTEFNNWLDNNGGATATDICGNVNWINSFSGNLNDGCGATGSTIITFTVSDDCGNTSQTTAAFNITDNTPPAISGQAQNLIVECDGQGNQINIDNWLGSNAGALATDLCGNVIWSNNYTNLSTLCGVTGSAVVTFTATDDCGNAGQTTASYTVVDTTPPDIGIGANDLTVECDGGGNGNDLINWIESNGGAVATELCGNISWSNNFNGSLTDDCGATGSTTVVFTATDDCGNTSHTSATFTIVDTTIPNIPIPAVDLTVECDGQGNQINLDNWLQSNAGAGATDVCGGNITWSNNFTNISELCAGTGSATVTFTATDDCGNSANTTATFTIIDTTPPDIGIGAIDLTVECDGGGNGTELNNWLNSFGGAGATELCSNVTWTNDFSGTFSDDCGATGNAVVTFTASDDCGNSAQTTTTFTIVDNTPPTISGQANDLTVECDGQGNQINIDNWLQSNAGALATDICGGDISWSSNFNGLTNDCGDTGSTTVIFTATDDCGNLSLTTATFTIVDTTPPDIGIGAYDSTVECDGNGNQTELNNWLNNQGGAGAIDLCGNINWNNDFTTILNDCGFSGSTVVTFTVADDCGNNATTTALFTIVDNTPPEINGVPEDITVACNNIPASAQPTAQDACDNQVDLAFNEVKLDGNCLDSYTLLRTWTATDDCGNISAKTQTITVEDNTPPTISGLPVNEVVECGAIPTPATPVVSDNCDIEVTVDFSEVRIDGNCTDNYTLTRTWTATDNCGNQEVHTQTITVQDNTIPNMAGVPADFVVDCSFIPPPAEPLANDNCDSDVEISFNEVRTDGNCTHNYVLTRTWIATDNCGNQNIQTQLVTVKDEVSPTLLGVPFNTTVQCAEIPAPAQPTANDNCDTDVVITFNENSIDGSCENSFTLVRTWTATDACGNTDMQTQVITVQDITNPVITGVPGNINVECDAIPTPAQPTATDNCDTFVDISFNETRTDGGCQYNYTLTRIWTATDNCGNQDIQTQIISVEDNTAPVMVGVPDDFDLDCSFIPPPAEPLATDNCDTDVDISFNEIQVAGDCPFSYTLLRTWTASDNCGNQDIQTQTIIISDEVSPNLIGIPFDNPIVECDAIPAPPKVTATDNCDPNVQVSLNEVQNKRSVCR